MKTHQIIEQVLSNNQNARNSDKILQLKVWERLGFFLSETQKVKYMSMPASESITRCRRTLQAEGKYPSTKEIKKKRDFKSMQMQQTRGSNHIIDQLNLV